MLTISPSLTLSLVVWLLQVNSRWQWEPFSPWVIPRKIPPSFPPTPSRPHLSHVDKDSIVIITSIVVAATAAAISSKFGTFSRIGGIIGTSVSSAVLILLGLANMYILWKLVKQMRSYLHRPANEDPQLNMQGYGCMFRLLRKLFMLMDRWVTVGLLPNANACRD